MAINADAFHTLSLLLGMSVCLISLQCILRVGFAVSYCVTLATHPHRSFFLSQWSGGSAQSSSGHYQVLPARCDYTRVVSWLGLLPRVWYARLVKRQSDRYASTVYWRLVCCRATGFRLDRVSTM